MVSYNQCLDCKKISLGSKLSTVRTRPKLWYKSYI